MVRIYNSRRLHKSPVRLLSLVAVGGRDVDFLCDVNGVLLGGSSWHVVRTGGSQCCPSHSLLQVFVDYLLLTFVGLGLKHTHAIGVLDFAEAHAIRRGLGLRSVAIRQLVRDVFVGVVARARGGAVGPESAGEDGSDHGSLSDDNSDNIFSARPNGCSLSFLKLCIF